MRMRQVAMAVLVVMGVANTVSMRRFVLTVSVRQEPHRARRRQGEDDRHHADRVETPNRHYIQCSGGVQAGQLGLWGAT